MLVVGNKVRFRAGRSPKWATLLTTLAPGTVLHVETRRGVQWVNVQWAPELVSWELADDLEALEHTSQPCDECGGNGFLPGTGDKAPRMCPRCRGLRFKR